MKKLLIPSVLLSLLLTQCQSSAAPAGEAGRGLDAFWQTNTEQEAESVAPALSAQAGDVDTLYTWLSATPNYPADAPVGQVSLSRTDASGTEFPYVLLVPEDYKPSRAYPVEFNLHGGVNRPKIQPGESAWRGGYDSLKKADRIVVVPVAWSDAFWWLDNQADNLPAILHKVKQTYHVDDNRVYLSGVSDGGTGSYFFAFMQPTEWAAFLPYIGHPGVLSNPRARISYPLFFENLPGKPLFIVNGENDRLYPARAMQPYIDLMTQAKADFEYTVIPGGEHNTAWMPDQIDRIEAFKRQHVRDPLPDRLQWISNRTDRYNRNHWIRIDGLRTEGEPGRLVVEREGNNINVTANYVTDFTLLLSPTEVDFGKPVTVTVNGEVLQSGLIAQSADTLLKWAAKDRDRSMLFTAELNLHTP